MLKFFDYLYYCTLTFYNETEGKGSELSALAIVALAQNLNVFIIYFSYCLISESKADVSKLFIVGTYIFFLVVNGIRYSKLDPGIIKEKWNRKNNKRKITLRILLLMYVVLSVALFFGLAIYLGSSRR